MLDHDELPPGVVEARPVTHMTWWQRAKYGFVLKTITRMGYVRGYLSSAYQYGMATGCVAFATSVTFMDKDGKLKTATGIADHLKAIQDKAKAAR